MEQAKAHLPDVIYCDSAYEAAEGAAAIVIATEWEQFRALDLDRLRQVMAGPLIVDLRNVYRADQMQRANFRYVTVGRPAAERHAEDARPQRRKIASVKASAVQSSSRPKVLSAG
jgi:UDPglucose 6-dehydrogenase